MKKKLENNCWWIILFFVSLLFISYYFYKEYSFFKKEDSSYLYYQEQIESGKLKDDDLMYVVMTNVYRPHMPDKVNLFLRVTSLNDGYNKLSFFYPIIIFFFSGFIIHREMKSGMIKNKLIRQKYSRYKLSNFFKAYKYAFIIPLVLTIIVIGLNLFIKSSANQMYKWVSEGYIYSASDYDIYKLGNVFFIIYIFLFLLYSLFLTNISLISAAKSKNYLIGVMFSYAFYLVLNIVLEGFIGPILDNTFNTDYIWATIIFPNYYGFVSKSSQIPLFIFFSVVLLIISWIILFLTYHKKERVLINHEN